MSKSKNRLIPLLLTEDQVWVIAKALSVLSSEEQVEKLMKEFPNMDLETLSNNLDAILEQLEGVKE
jgi:hypothetical protein